MRRLFLIFLMCLLPLQSSWAAAASVCAHEPAKESHFGHHEHKHSVCAAVHADADEHAAHSHGDAPNDNADGKPAGNHPDCQVCHGIGAAFAQYAQAQPGNRSDRGAFPAYAGVLPEPPFESFLRPPLTLVA